MCIKAGSNELESVKNLMSMSLMAVVAEALHLELDQVNERARLTEDLGMDSAGRRRLEAMIAEVFDGAHINPALTPTVSALLDQVVLSEFAEDEVRELAGIGRHTLSA